jgi:transmembrane sensor
MTNQDVQQLLKKYLAGSCTEQERALLETWYLQHEDLSLPPLTQVQLSEIENSIPPPIFAHRSVVKLWPRIAAAAAVLLFVVTGAYYALHKAPLLVSQQHISASIKPGFNKAILTLANGKKVVLNDAKIGRMAEDANSIVQKAREGELVYGAKGNAIASTAFNTIETPRGGQYQVTLADGTKVWLNAASSITYPTAFTGSERRVKLKGEAYFEVAKNKQMPFRVQSTSQTVEVLGTHFNVSAYDDDPSDKTTLLEGSVRLNNKVTIKPGEQSIIRGSDIKVNEVNTEDAIAWKNGKFKFEKENIKDLMRKVARWYDVQVFYEGEMTRQNFSGSVSRYDDISKILGFLESTNTIHFKIEERRITVMP